MRYYIYYWTKLDIADYEKDYGEFDLLPNTCNSLIQYATKIGKTNDEKEALDICNKQSEKMSYFDVVSIWDSYEKCWFN